MMNQQQMMNQQNRPINPLKIDKYLRKQIVNSTISQTKIGNYSKLFYTPTQKYNLVKECKISSINNICNVTVVHKHSLEAVYPYCEKGIDFSKKTSNYNPVILNVVGNDFSGNIELSDDINDDLIVFRTTFNNISIPKTGASVFPLRKNTCAYSKIVYTIRSGDSQLGMLNYNELYRYSMIIISPTKVEKLLNNEEMYSDDYLKSVDNIELIFQAAIAGGNDVLVLTPFGDNKEDNNPENDIIKIYNYCIYKYGHYFKEIIFAIPHYYEVEIYELYDKNILKLQDLLSQVDEKYDTLKMKNKIENCHPIKNNNLIKKNKNIDNNSDELNVLKKILDTYNLDKNKINMLKEMFDKEKN